MTLRSPIEMLVDQACGILPGAATARTEHPYEREAAALLSVGDTAKAWRIALQNGSDACEEQQNLESAIDAWIALGG